MRTKLKNLKDWTGKAPLSDRDLRRFSNAKADAKLHWSKKRPKTLGGKIPQSLVVVPPKQAKPMDQPWEELVAGGAR